MSHSTGKREPRTVLKDPVAGPRDNSGSIEGKRAVYYLERDDKHVPSGTSPVVRDKERPAMPSAKVNGISMYYEVHGKGDGE